MAYFNFVFKVVLRLNMQMSCLAVQSHVGPPLHQLHMGLTRPSGIKRVKIPVYISQTRANWSDAHTV